MTKLIYRPLKDRDLSSYLPHIAEYEAYGVLPEGPLDYLRAEIWPSLEMRTAITLMLIINHIYREIALRHLENQ